jgi:hypothetical protein
VLNPDQARALAEEYFNGARDFDEATEVGLWGFEDGYVGWACEPEPHDPSVLPEVVGGGCVIIDKATGELEIRPLLAPDIVAEQWPGRRPR